jgi:hypothetical protein
MDPYLEAHWPDVHGKLVTYAADALNSQLPEDLIARTEERVAVESDADIFAGLSPDVRVIEAVGATAPQGPEAEGGGRLAPYRLVAVAEPLTERFIEIIDSAGDRLVTVIEFVSPANKRGKGLKSFVRKRAALLSGGVSFVELDLVRAGNWRALMRPHHCPPRLVSLYRAAIRVRAEPLAVYLQPISLREPLPILKIPLRDGEEPAQLALQPLLEKAYQNGKYARTIDYSRPLDPPLQEDDTLWARSLLKSGRNA